MPLSSPNILGTAEVGFARTATAAAVNTALADAIAVAAVGVASYQIASAVRCKALGAGATGCDDGADRETITDWTASGTNFTNGQPQTANGSSAEAACNALWPKLGGTTNQGGGATNTQTFSDRGTTPLGPCLGARFSHDVAGNGSVYDSGPFNVSYGVAQAARQQCPASVDASNPANSIPAGQPVGIDGKCATGRYSPKSAAEVAAKVGQVVDAALRANALKEALDAGGRVVAQPGVLTGPASLTGDPETVRVTGPNGVTTTTTTPRTRFGYDGETITATDDPIRTTVDPDGTTTTTEGTPEKIDIETCGLPGKPPCKIDETGTPTQPPTPPDTPDKLKTDDAAKRDAAISSIQDPGFGWIGAPAIAQCTPFDWPAMGHTYTLDPCGPMEQIRGVMAYVWALFGAWWCFGLVRKTVAGA
ncbi:MAG: hypothetical protein ABI671_12085 [Burkholderiales bacterium]